MNILVITNIFPFPLNEGGKTSQFVYLKELVKNHNVTLGCIGPCSSQDISSFQNEIPNLEIINCYKVSESPKTKIKHRLLKKLIWEINKLLPRINEKPFENEFFISPIRPRDEDNYKSIESLFKKKHWDIVQVDFIDNADLAIIIPPEFKKILVVHDIRFISVQQSLIQSMFSSPYISYFSNVLQTIELSYMRLFDGIVTFSEEDKNRLTKNLPESLIMAAPFGISDNLFIELPQQKKINQLIFLGGDGHVPNIDAVHWYAEEFSEAIFAAYGWDLHVVGNWSEYEKRRIVKRKLIHFTGFIEDLSTYVGNSVMIVPLRIGSGIRTKILEAFALGIPVISTSIGAEGICAFHEKEILIANNKSEFLDCLNQLQDANFRYQIVVNARSFARNNFSQRKTSNDRVNFFKKILD